MVPLFGLIFTLVGFLLFSAVLYEYKKEYSLLSPLYKVPRHYLIPFLIGSAIITFGVYLILQIQMEYVLLISTLFALVSLLIYPSLLKLDTIKSTHRLLTQYLDLSPDEDEGINKLYEASPNEVLKERTPKTVRPIPKTSSSKVRIIPHHAGDSIIGQMLEMLGAKPPVGIVAEYNFGDAFLNDYDEFELYSYKCAISHLMLHNYNIAINDSEKTNLTQLFDIEIDAFLSRFVEEGESAKILRLQRESRIITYVPKMMLLMGDANSNPNPDTQKQMQVEYELFGISHTNIFPKLYESMTDDEAHAWRLKNIHALEPMHIFMIWYYAVMQHIVKMPLVMYT
jgi:hypothetical protein